MAEPSPKDVCVTVDPGICGFPCVIKAGKMGARMVSLEISGSDCGQIKKLSERLTRISLKDIFAPISRNPVYALTEKSVCHLSCAVPVAVIKAAEVAFEMALPKEVHIRFVPCEEEKTDPKSLDPHTETTPGREELKACIDRNINKPILSDHKSGIIKEGFDSGFRI